MTTALNLKYRDLSWLGHAFDELSIISPFKLIQVEGFTESDRQALVTKGVVGENNQVLPGYHQILDTLAGADHFIETVFSRGPVKARRMHLGKDHERVSLSYSKDGVDLIHPANPRGMINFLQEYTGGSSLTGGDLSIELSPALMVLFGVISDLYRKAVFAAYAEEEIFNYRGFTSDELLDAALNVRNNSQSLAFHIKSLVPPGIAFDRDQILQALDSLLEQSLLKKEDHRYFPIDEALLFSGNFLVIESSLDVVVGQVHEGELFRSGFTVLQAGPLDLVLLEGSKESVTLQCLSAQSILSILGSVFENQPMIV
ncbi:MAG: hypothetical protein AVO33_08850 [delta proteobacterium ML8_F1]|nr:MAG: hypothetical protein AVO33_08850 [delta proteobacterium ML8_F1]